MQTTLAVLPILTFLVFILGFKKSVFSSAIISTTALVGIGLFAWQIEPLRILSASFKGLFFALEIILVIFGALLIYEILKRSDLLSTMGRFIESISRDKPVQVILIGWALVHFIEGVSGFGTPIIVAVPIFLALGFAPISAIILSLIGGSVPVIFGAVGLPVTFGIYSVVSGLTQDISILEITKIISLFNVIGSILIPVTLLFVYTKLEKKPFSDIKSYIPFAIVIGLITSASAILTAHLFGPELPSIVGGLISLSAIYIFTKFNLFLPASKLFDDIIDAYRTPPRSIDTLRALSPYLIVAGLLLISRLPYFPIRAFLENIFVLHIQSLFSFEINYTFLPLYSAGIILIFSGFISFFIARIRLSEFRLVITETAIKICKPFFSLAAILVFVQIFLYSGENSGEFASMPIVLASATSAVFGNIWPIVAPFIGALGLFITGSATVSNLIFSSFQYSVATATGFNAVLILSLQGIGAAAGNMIAIHNVIAALAVAGLTVKEHVIIRKNLPILLIYLLILGLVGYLISFIF